MRNKLIWNNFTILGGVCLVAFATQTVAFAQAKNTPAKLIAPAEESKKEKILKARGTIRDADALSDGTLFYIEYEHKSVDNRATSTLIRQFDLGGRLLVTENTIYDESGKLKKYSLEQSQTNTSATVEIVDKNILMSWNENGSIKTSSDKATENTVAAGSLMAYMSPHTKSLSQGETLNVRLALPERGHALEFSISAQKEESCASLPTDLCVNLSLKNFILKKLLSPIRMSFQKTTDGYRPLNLESPAVVRRERGKKLEKFTARIDYPRL